VGYETINSGLEAMNYYQAYRAATDEGEKEKLKSDLILYCSTDCRSTTRLMGFLEMVSK